MDVFETQATSTVKPKATRKKKTTTTINKPNDGTKKTRAPRKKKNVDPLQPPPNDDNNDNNTIFNTLQAIGQTVTETANAISMNSSPVQPPEQSRIPTEIVESTNADVPAQPQPQPQPEVQPEEQPVALFDAAIPVLNKTKKVRAPRKPKDPNAPPPKPRAPRKPKDPNAPPPKPCATRKKKKPIEPENIRNAEADVNVEMKQDNTSPFPGEKPVETELDTDKSLEKTVEEAAPEPENVSEHFVQEKQEHDSYKQNTNSLEWKTMYPSLNDPNFNIRITEKQEYNHLYRTDDTKKENIEEFANTQCKSEFQILPHQQFVRNFMSIDTPFNSLLLYHELGTGKTCSAIGVAEETRRYLKRSGITRQTIVVGNSNILSNFRLQLFDPSKLVEHGRKGVWSLDTCVGESLLGEINQHQLQGKTREQITKQISSMIDSYYTFVGYQKLANLIESKLKGTNVHMENLKDVTDTDSEEVRKQQRKQINRVKSAFDNTLFIIDEAHNILQRDENRDKRAAMMLIKLAKYCNNIRFILLSATPMYNTHQEMIWMINLMNMNDKRPIIKTSQVFNGKGEFVIPKTDSNGIVTREGGRDLLKRKLTGYVSYVRGENPFTFPFRIYPTAFSENQSETLIGNSYPTQLMTEVSLNGEKIEHLDLYVNTLEGYQKEVYMQLVQNTLKQKKELANFKENTAFFIQWMLPLTSTLNMTYPVDDIFTAMKKRKETSVLNNENPATITKDALSLAYSRDGMRNCMHRNSTTIGSDVEVITFGYKNETIQKYKRIFQEPQLSSYSKKIGKICECIKNAKGIVLIYSNYLDFGLIPVCLALEEMGMKRYCKSEHIGENMLELPEGETFPENTVGKYILVTGSMVYSPSNRDDIQMATNPKNTRGEQVKVILISGAGSEGIDLKCVRQVHILEPWYNLNRIEQAIGRAVRTRSHCALPFKERNVEIYMHSSYLNGRDETVDMYLYRIAEKKAMEIGKISRVLKETAVDCLLNNTDTQNYTKEYMNQTIPMLLSNGKTIQFEVGDKPFSHICDYMESCTYTCDPNVDVKSLTVTQDTYNTNHLHANHSRILKRVRQLFRDKTFFTEKELIEQINVGVPYLLQEIYYTLSHMVETESEWIVHKGVVGHLIESKNTYAFQPNNLPDKRASVYEREKPVDIKRERVVVKVPVDMVESKVPTETKIKSSVPVPVPVQPSRRLPIKGLKPNTSSVTGATTGTTTMREMEKQIDVENVDDVEETAIVPDAPVPAQPAQNIMTHIYEKIKYAMEDLPSTYNQQRIRARAHPEGEYRWYSQAPLAYAVLRQYHGFSNDQIVQYTVERIIDELPFSQRMIYVKECFQKTKDFQSTNPSTLPPITSSDSITESHLRHYVKQHLCSKMHLPTTNTREYPQLLISKGIENLHYMFNIRTKQWEFATENIVEFEKPYVQSWISQFNTLDQIHERVKFNHPYLLQPGYKSSDMNVTYISFTGLNKTREEDGYVFKTKDVLETRNNVGSKCFHRDDAIKHINSIMRQSSQSIQDNQNPLYTTQSCKTLLPNLVLEKGHLCITLELLSRHLQHTHSQLWFLSTEQVNETKFLGLRILVQNQQLIDEYPVFTKNAKTKKKKE